MVRLCKHTRLVQLRQSPELRTYIKLWHISKFPWIRCSSPTPISSNTNARNSLLVVLTIPRCTAHLQANTRTLISTSRRISVEVSFISDRDVVRRIGSPGNGLAEWSVASLYMMRIDGIQKCVLAVCDQGRGAGTVAVGPLYDFFVEVAGTNWCRRGNFRWWRGGSC